MQYLRPLLEFAKLDKKEIGLQIQRKDFKFKSLWRYNVIIRRAEKST
jgi:hypothetical protein